MKSNCKYCDPDMSFGNKAIYKEDGTELYIANDLLKFHKSDWVMTRSIVVEYCPMCGRKLKPLI